MISPCAESKCKDADLSPTVFRAEGYRFFLFSREEERIHIHVQHATGEAKFWMEPSISLAESHGLSPRRIRAAMKLAKEHRDEIHRAWKAHFGR